ncbi:MAG: efflux RND transporter periplasmic adaptor subunit, partial [Pseudomonadota bacterium]|nr:efflux RND transporter periplasmic adaptor subunit [Pseudomonadota bacterium]
AALPVEKNENIKAGQPIVVVNCGQRLEVEVAVPESLIIAIQTGQPTTVTFDALPKQSFAATITEVGVASSQATTTFPVIVRLQDSTPEIRPGMTAEVSFQFATQDSTLVVPSAAVHEDRQGRFVFVVEPLENKELAIVHRRAVEVGALTENGLEILSGLQVGEQVVTAGISQLQEGLKVRLLPEKPYNS